LQGMSRPATSLHEELCRSDLQDRVPDVHEVMREEIAAQNETFEFLLSQNDRACVGVTREHATINHARNFD